MWLPDLSRSSVPRYQAIAEALAADMASGRLAAGSRLPTHRDLAEALGVTVGTVTRAYAEAARRGLVSGEVGRGTFVRRAAGDVAARALEEAPAGLIELATNHPPRTSEVTREQLARTLRELGQSPDTGRLLDYPPDGGAEGHRAAGARWVEQVGLRVKADQVLLTSGSQHALTTVFTALLRPGDTLLTEALTYPGMKALAALLGLKLQPLPIDAEGLLPEAFEAACRAGAAKALYVVPTLHNPTTSVMPVARRREIARIAEAHGVLVLEDDVHGPLVEPIPPALSSFLPELGFYLAGTAKTLAPGLRIGFLVAPPQRVPRLSASIRATTWMPAPLLAELTARWIDDGTAAATLRAHRAEAEARQTIAARVLDGHELETHPRAFHLWLHLPEPWRSDTFVDEARRRGVAVSPSQAFVVGRGSVPAAVRLCLGAPRDRAQLEVGLGILADILDGPADTAMSIV
jgi:DNA-binding transcriptional MocR family regulator